MEDMSPIQTITHLRVGTMFTWVLLGLNFVDVPTGGGSIKPYHTHLAIKDAKAHGWYDRLKKTEKPTIYIVRDGRDVLVSQFYFCKRLKTDFHGFIRGEGNLDIDRIYRKNPFPSIQLRVRENPAKAWIDHTQWIKEDWVDLYWYEWIRNNQEEFIIELADRYNLKTIHDYPKPVKKLVGVKPRKGIVGDWKNHFDDEDLEYFWDIAGKRMEELGYDK
jgi:hypothetical protein